MMNFYISDADAFYDTKPTVSKHQYSGCKLVVYYLYIMNMECAKILLLTQQCSCA